jgi:hypothetical protein
MVESIGIQADAEMVEQEAVHEREDRIKPSDMVFILKYTMSEGLQTDQARVYALR